MENSDSVKIFRKFLKTSSFILLGIFLFVFSSQFTHAATIGWDGGGSDDNWSTANNWNTNSVPGSNDDVKVTSTSDNIDIDTDVEVKSIEVGGLGGYNGTITATSSKDIGITTTDKFQVINTGTVKFMNNDVDINGLFMITGDGTVSSTSGNLRLSDNVTFSGVQGTGNFAHNSGTVIFDGSGDVSVTSSGQSFNQIKVSKPTSTDKVTAQDNLNGHGKLTLESGQLDMNQHFLILKSGSGESVSYHDFEQVGGAFNGTGNLIQVRDLILKSGISILSDGNTEVYRNLNIGPGNSLNNNGGNIELSCAGCSVTSSGKKLHKLTIDGSANITLKDDLNAHTLDFNLPPNPEFPNTTLNTNSKDVTLAGSLGNGGMTEIQNPPITLNDSSSTFEFKKQSEVGGAIYLGEVSNLKINNNLPGYATRVARSNFSIGNNLTIEKGSFVTTFSGSLTVTGTTKIKEDGTLTIGSGSNSTFYGDLVLQDQNNPQSSSDGGHYNAVGANMTYFKDGADLKIDGGAADVASSSSISFENGKARLVIPHSTPPDFGRAGIAQPVGGGQTSKDFKWYHPASIETASNNNKIDFPKGVTMTLELNESLSKMEAKDRVSSTPSNIDNSAVTGGGLQFGMPGNPTTDKDVTIQLDVASSKNGQTLDTFINDAQTSGWEKHNSCTVSNGLCQFTTRNFSQFTAGIETSNNNSNNSNNSSSSGGSFTLTLTKPEIMSGHNKAVEINGDASETNNRDVELEFFVKNASKLAVSEDKNFPGVSLMDFPTSSKMNFKLSSGEEKKTVYTRFLSEDGKSLVGSDSIDYKNISNSSSNKGSSNNQKTCSLKTQQAYKHSQSNAVYYITNNCTKRPFKNPDIFFSYFDSWNDVSLTDKSVLDDISKDNLGFMPWGPKREFRAGTLFKTVVDPKVYIVQSSGNKCWIESEEVFNALNYKFNQIEDVDPRVLNDFDTCDSPINYTDHHPNYTLIKYSDDSKVYLLEPSDDGQMKRPIANEKVFEERGFRFDRVVAVPKTETYPTGSKIQ